jgi:hypothetical protein
VALQAALGRAWESLRTWGWPAALGLVLIAAAIGAACLVTPSIDRATDRLLEDAQALRKQTLRQARTGSAPMDDWAGAQAFRGAFPPPGRRATRVAALLALAEAHGVVVRRGEFRYQPEPALGLARYSLSLPVEGSYSALRAFVAEGLGRDPALALDGMRLSRDQEAAGGLRADLRFTLYMRIDTAAAAGVRP